MSASPRSIVSWRRGIARDNLLEHEVLGAEEMAADLAAPGGAVEVEENRGDAVHVQGEGVAEEEQKEDGDGQGKAQGEGVPHDLDEFLPGDGF